MLNLHLTLLFASIKYIMLMQHILSPRYEAIRWTLEKGNRGQDAWRNFWPEPGSFSTK